MSISFPPPALASDSCGWRIDLRSHIMFSPEAFDGEKSERTDFWYSTYQHESAHWVRWQSSSIGILLSALQRARGLTAYEALRHLDIDTRSRILRDACDGVPIWSFESGYAPELAGEKFALAGQFWLDQYLAYQVLFDDSQLDGIRCPEESFSCAFADAWLACSTFPTVLEHPGNDIAEHIITGAIEPVVRFGHRLTTRSLWECASTLDEIRASQEQSKESWQEQLRMINYKLEDDLYGGPWQVANRICRGGTSVNMFQIAVYIATNPPLPFLEGNIKKLGWTDIYPPARFLKAYEYISQHRDALHERATLDPIENEIEELIKIIVDGADIPFSTTSSSEQITFTEHPSVAQPIVGDINHVIRVSLALRARWRETPWRYIYPAITDIYDIGDAEDVSSKLMTHRLTSPPLMQFSNGLRNSGLLNEVQNGQYCTSSFLRNSIESLVTGRGIESSCEYLPIEFPAQEYSDRLPEILASKLVKIYW